VNRFWGFLFLLVPLLGVGSFVLAMLDVWPMQGLWLPENLSESGKQIDHLWYVSHTICAIILLVTGLVLSIAVWRYGRRHATARYISHNTRLELVWTLIPAGILIWITYYQMSSWNENKLWHPTRVQNGATVEIPPMARVVARRFSWEIYYPGADGKLETMDDLYFENELVVPYGEDIVLQMESRDVIHSFFVPNLRLKQDVIPGRKQMLWFRATGPGELALICAELCGWGHYTMQGRVRLVTRAEFDDWMAAQLEQQLEKGS
jgi:cytochrome c oxidase subunit 2